MFKKHFVIVFIVAIVLSTSLFLYFNRGEGFPHFKQAAMQYSGTVFYSGENIEYDVSFNFIDENEYSEMSDKDNIKEIVLGTEDNEKIKVNNWEIDSRPFEDYTVRNLLTKINLKGDKDYVINNVSLIYADGKEEIFNIGKLKIKSTNNWDSDSEIYNSTQEANPIGDSKYDISVTLSSIDKCTINIKNIDIGIEGITVDLNDLKISEDDNEPVALGKSKEIHLKEYSYTTIIIPLNMKEYKELHKKILVFNPKIEYERDGNTCTIIGDQNLAISPRVGNSKVDEIKAGKYIEENGI